MSVATAPVPPPDAPEADGGAAQTGAIVPSEPTARSDAPAPGDLAMQIGLLAPLAILAAVLGWRAIRATPAEPAGRLPRDPAIGAFGFIASYIVGGTAVTLATALESPLGIEAAHAVRLWRGLASSVMTGALVSAAIASPLFVDAPRVRTSARRAVLEGAAGFALAMPFVAFLGLALQWILPLFGLPRAPDASHETLALLREHGGLVFTSLTLVHVAILVPIAEEAVWRGMLQPAMRRAGMPAFAACAVTAVLFAGIHWSMLAPEGRAVGLAMLAVLGFALGILRERTGGILAPVVLHGLFNAANVAIALR